MREVFPQLRPVLASGEPFALATVFRTDGSAPRPAGASLVVTAGGEVIGSVSGGCVEAAVHELCRQALEDGCARTGSFGVSDDDDPFAVGLTCGGTLDVLVQPFAPADGELLRRALHAEAHGQAVALASVVAAPGTTGAGTALLGRWLLVGEEGAEGSLGAVGLDEAVARGAAQALRAGRDELLALSGCADLRHGEVEVFVEVIAPPPRMLVFGAVEPAAALTRVGKFLGYHVTVCDARGLFATEARFPEADEVVVQWPDEYLRGTAVDERTVVCVLTHDAKFDVPLLKEALRGPAGYVGAMGSRRTHDDRVARLLAEGLSPGELARLASPIGLDLGARTPQETAVSIAAEIVAHRRGGSGTRLSRTDGPIHRAGERSPVVLAQAGSRP
ncbi:XdhC family protein [Kineococcus esterisolvens]|uniref:XdhC family protein n=1 Tax=unclassified Kineococcus TaxID=2621656 RepID=UPI003D7E3309